MAVTYTSSWREISCTQTSNAKPEPFFDLQLDQARVHETELSLRVFATKRGVPLHRCTPVRARVDHGDPIEDTLIVLGMCIERLDNEPLIGMCNTHLCPAHISRVGTDSDSEQLLDEAEGVFASTSFLDGSLVAASQN